MSSDEISLNESDGFHINKIRYRESIDLPLVTSFKPHKDSSFLDSLTYAFFKEVFLPQGFPDSVHKDYVSYQIWDTLQAFASTINGTLTTHSIMRGVGVGQSTATPLAAAITWVLKDGTGMVGRIIFAWWQGNNLDSQCKKWRLFADILNDAAMTLEVIVPYISVLSSHILCLTTGMKAIVGIAGGATRTAIMQHHAMKDNLADISAKEHSQGTLVNLVGSIVGILILLYIPERLFINICFILVFIHIMSNYFGVTSLQMNTLNEDRLCLIIEDYLLHHKVPDIEEANKRESVFILLEKPAKKIFGFDIEIGVSFENIIKMKLIKSQDTRHLISFSQRRKYLPVMDLKQRKIYVILSKDIEDIQIIRAYFHSCMYAIIASNALKMNPGLLVNKKSISPSYRFSLIDKLSKTFLKSNNQVHEEFVSAMDELVCKDWHLFTMLLNKSEWVLKANMLPMKSWRCSFSDN